MRDLPTIARRMLETRATAQRLEAAAEAAVAAGSADPALTDLDMARLLMFKGAAQMLAWVLEVDLAKLDSPALTNLPEAPADVTLYRVDMGDVNDTHPFWLMEVPAHTDETDPGFSTEAWSVFLSDAQARSLRAALARALTTPLTPTPAPTRTPLFFPRSPSGSSPSSPSRSRSSSSSSPRGGKGA